MYGFQFDWFYWTVTAALVAGALVLAVRWQVSRDSRALRALLIIVTASIFGGTALAVAANFFCARLYSTSPLTFDIVAYALILAAFTHIVRLRLRRRRRS